MAKGRQSRADGLIGFALASVLLLPCASAVAQFKVVGPDGRTTYTDRPPPATPAQKVREVDTGGAAATAIPLANLPLELRTAVTRYPVTLYAIKACEACDAARQWLVQRGVPFVERSVSSTDGDAVLRLTGARELPALTLGKQSLRGFAPDQWSAYLDAAGYPRQSRLPAGYVAPPPTPLATAPVPAAAASPAAASVERTETQPASSSGGIRF